MKKTYVTTMPDNVGAFLRASRRIAALGINITRVSYDKAVDLHTLFIELDADEDKLRIADAQLAELGYVNSPATRRGIVLLGIQTARRARQRDHRAGADCPL